MYDSVFFNKTNSLNEKLILGEKEVLFDLESLEKKSKILLSKIPVDAASKFLKLNHKTPETVKSIFFQLIQQALWATWLAGWKLGISHAQKEIQLLSPPIKNFFSQSNIIQFAADQTDVKERTIRNIPAENAIKGRINQLSSDVTNSEYEQIKGSVLAAVTPDSSGAPISRAELIRQIEDTLGSKSGRYSNRAETIARTELTFAYNAGRLDTYQQSNLVAAVRFYTISDERRCSICASRQGLVIPLEDSRTVTQNTPPMHPRCRCVLSPVLKNSKELHESDRSIENRELVPRPLLWAAAGILSAVLISKSASVRISAAEEGIVGSGSKALRRRVITTPIDEPVEPIDIGEVMNLPQPVPQATRPTAIAPTAQTKIKLMAGNVDLNTATRSQLQKLLPGRLLNVRMVNEILRYRDANGPFQSVDDLKKIPGIGDRTLARLKQIVEGSEIFIFLDPSSVRTPAQLWASNLGLTRAQAKTIFEEMQRGGAFKDFDDLKQRLAGRGIGEKTIENIQARAIIVQRNIQ